VAAAVAALARHAPTPQRPQRQPQQAPSPLARAAAAVAAAARARQRDIAAATLELAAARAPDMQARQLSSCMQALARLGPWIASLPAPPSQQQRQQQQQQQRAGSHPPPLPPTTPLAARHRAVCVDLVRRSGDRLADFTPQGLATVLWACAHLGHRPGDAWVGGWLAAAAGLRGSFNGQDLALSAWALGRLGVKPSGGWAEAFARASEPGLAGMRPGELVSLAGGFAAMRRPPGPGWWAAAARAAQPYLLASSSSASWSSSLGVPEMSGQEQSTLLWAMAVARAAPPDAGWARDFEAAALAAAPTLAPRTAATLLWSLGRLSHGEHWSWRAGGLAADAVDPADCLPRALQRRLVALAEQEDCARARAAGGGNSGGQQRGEEGGDWRGADVAMALMGFARLCARVGASARVAEPRFAERLLASAPAARVLRPTAARALADDDDDEDGSGDEAMGDGASAALGTLSAEDLANMAWALGALSPSPNAAAAVAASAAAATATAAPAPAAAASCRSAPKPPEAWWRAFLEATRRAAAAGEFSHAQLGALLWGVARVCGGGAAGGGVGGGGGGSGDGPDGSPSPPAPLPPPPRAPDLRWWAAVLGAVASELPRASPTSLSHALWALGALGVRPNREWVEALLGALGRRLPRCNGRDLTAAGEGLRRLGYRPPRAWAESFARCAGEKRRLLDARQRRALGEALVAMGLGAAEVGAAAVLAAAEEEEDKGGRRG